MPERESSFSPEVFEPASYDEAIENILLDNENHGLTWSELLGKLGEKFWDPAGVELKQIMTPEKIEKIDAALRKVGALKHGMPSMDIPDRWFAKKTHGPTWFEKKIMRMDDRLAR